MSLMKQARDGLILRIAKGCATAASCRITHFSKVLPQYHALQHGTRCAILRRTRFSESFECVIEAIESLLENRTRRGNVEAQPGFAAGPELLTGACENARPILDPRCDVAGRQPGA